MGRDVLLIAALLTLVAAIPRFYDLAALGFYGDEETTALPAQALASGQGAQMPSGMPYRRALPLTWLNALSARLLGLDREVAYRIPAAIFGTLTIPLLFFLARPWLGASVALVAAILLAVSDWHIATSREARMYAPFLFFYIAAAFAILHWATNTWRLQNFLLAAGLFLATVIMHTLGMLVIVFALIPLVFARWSRIASHRLLIFAFVAAGVAQSYTQFVVNAPFNAWRATLPTAAAGNDSAWGWLGLFFTTTSPWILASALLGLSGGWWAARLGQPGNDNATAAWFRTLARYLSATAVGVLAGLGYLYGALMAAVVYLLLNPEGAWSLAKKIWPALSLILTAALVPVFISGSQAGLSGLKELLLFPFPYPVFMAQMFGGLFALFAITTAYMLARAQRPTDIALRAFIMAVILPFIAVGATSAWGGMRYLIEVYPFLLLIATTGLVSGLAFVGRRSGLWGEKTTTIAAVLIALSGLLGGHGIVPAMRIVTLQYGAEVKELIYTYPRYPDHKSAGEYVRKHMRPDDIVLAEDQIEQYWYVGKVDYWLRNMQTHHEYTYQGPDGQRRDIYTGAMIAGEKELLWMTQQTEQTVWLITSGETEHKRQYYLNPKQRQWLNNIEQNKAPAYTAKDGISTVYCLNCP